MKTLLSHIVAAGLLVATLSVPAHATYYDYPYYGWDVPIRAMRGTYLISVSTSYLTVPRTLRAKKIEVAPERNRIYMIIGQKLVAYDLDGFFSRIGSPLSKINRGTNPGESYLPWDASFDPQASSQWITPIGDGAEQLFDFDRDDRGYLYLAVNSWSWGILRDTGSSLSFVDQVDGADVGFSPKVIRAFKSGSSY